MYFMYFLCVHTIGENYSVRVELKRLHDVKPIYGKTGLSSQQRFAKLEKNKTNRLRFAKGSAKESK